MPLVKSPVLLNDRQRTSWLRSQSPSNAVIDTLPESYPVVAVVQVQSHLATDVVYLYPDDLKIAKVGTGATAHVGSDRYPYTVVEVISDKKLVVQRDEFRRTDSNGFSESQTYEYTANPDAEKVVITLRGNGRWVRQGESAKGGTGFSIGHRSAYQDPSF